MTEPEVLDLKAAAAFLNLSPEGLRRLALAGEVPGARLGSVWRFSRAALMVAAGVHMRVVAEQLGHANPALTARTYSHVSPESVATALTALDDAVRGTGRSTG